jgi:hypothetical protein
MDVSFGLAMVGRQQDDQFSDEETTRRMNEALRRALTSPPKPHSEMKIGKRKAKREPSKRGPRRALQEKADEPGNRP